MNEDYINIKINIVAQAKYYLEQANEFYPFGAVINKNHELKPVGIYFEDDTPNALDVLNRLENALTEGIRKGEYISAGIGVDVYVKIDQEKREALEVRFFEDEKMTNSYFLYFKKRRAILFSRTFTALILLFETVS